MVQAGWELPINLVVDKTTGKERAVRTVSRVWLLGLALLIWQGVSKQVAFSQEKTPTVSVMIEGADPLLKDLQFLASLTTTKEQEAWKKIIDKDEGILEIFLLGVERQKPLGLDILLGTEGQRYRFLVPFEDFDSFVSDNLGGFEVQAKQIEPNFYKLSGGGLDGFLRKLHGYAVMAEKREDVPASFPDPLQTLKPLKEGGYVLLAEIKNSKEGRDSRRQAIEQLGRNMVDALKQKPDETTAAFNLRKTALLWQIDEFKRFFADASHIAIGLKLNHQKKNAVVNLTLEALPKTELEKDVQLLNTKPSRFFVVQKHSDAILFAKIRFPLNKMRQQYLQKEVDLLRDAKLEQLTKDSKRTDQQKEKAKEAVKLLHQIGTDFAKYAMIDGFVEIRQTAPGVRTVLVGLAVPGATRMEQVLKLFAESREGRQSKLNVAEVGKVKIHQLEPADVPQILSDFSPGKIYVATGENELWLAAGSDALARLKEAVKELEQQTTKDSADPATDGDFYQFSFRCGPWFRFWDEQAKKSQNNSNLTEAEKTAREEAANLRKLAIEACQTGDDTISGTLKRTGNRVEGTMQLNESVLRFISKVVADFADKNL